jgi:hypothetical protein
VDPITCLNDLEKWKFLTLPWLKLRPFGSSARSQSLYRLRYVGGSLILTFYSSDSRLHVRRSRPIGATRREQFAVIRACIGWRRMNSLPVLRYTSCLGHCTTEIKYLNGAQSFFRGLPSLGWSRNLSSVYVTILPLTPRSARWSVSLTVCDQNLYAFLFSPVPHLSHTPVSLSKFSGPVIFDENYKLWNCSICCFLIFVSCSSPCVRQPSCETMECS